MFTESARILQAKQLIATGRPGDAVEMLRPLIAERPNHFEANLLMAGAWLAAGRAAEAEPFAKAAHQANTGSAEARMQYAAALVRLAKHAEAITHLEMLTKTSPHEARPWVVLVAACGAAGRIVDAERHARAALQRHPNVPEVVMNCCAAIRRGGGDNDEAVAMLRSMLIRQPGYLPGIKAMATGLNYASGATREEVLNWHAKLASGLGVPARPRRPDHADPDKKLRIGVLSPDLREHSVAYFAEPMLEHLDRGRFEIVVFQTGNANDAVSARLRAIGHEWHDVPMLNPPQLNTLIREKRIDVLIELSGWTIGTRLDAMVQRPAPVQLTYLGYPSTTGCAFIDGRIVDSHTDPAGVEAAHTEQLLRLDPCFICYRAPASAPPVRPRDDGPIVFACFGSMQKYTDGMMRMWSQVLQAVPGSKLLLKGRGMEGEGVAARLRERLATAGASPSQVEVFQCVQSTQSHLSMYHRADIALDTFPYHGTTTTCEAALMGVPTVTLVGSTHAARVGLTLNTNLGLAELAATSEQEFVNAAVSLAGDAARLADLRSGLRGRLLSGPLGDGAAFGARFGDAIRRCWAEACARP